MEFERVHKVLQDDGLRCQDLLLDISGVSPYAITWKCLGLDLEAVETHGNSR